MKLGLAILKLLGILIFLTISSIILFVINPIWGVLWILFWIVCLPIVTIWTIRKDLIMKFLGWLFGAKK